MTGKGDLIGVEVAYALPSQQVMIAVDVAPESTVEAAIRESGVLERFPEIDLNENRVGVFGKLAKLSDGLHPGDRIEIYRPLIADPKEVRRRRAASKG